MSEHSFRKSTEYSGYLEKRSQGLDGREVIELADPSYLSARIIEKFPDGAKRIITPKLPPIDATDMEAPLQFLVRDRSQSMDRLEFPVVEDILEGVFFQEKANLFIKELDNPLIVEFHQGTILSSSFGLYRLEYAGSRLQKISVNLSTEYGGGSPEEIYDKKLEETLPLLFNYIQTANDMTIGAASFAAEESLKMTVDEYYEPDSEFVSKALDFSIMLTNLVIDKYSPETIKDQAAQLLSSVGFVEGLTEEIIKDFDLKEEDLISLTTRSTINPDKVIKEMESYIQETLLKMFMCIEEDVRIRSNAYIENPNRANFQWRYTVITDREHSNYMDNTHDIESMTGEQTLPARLVFSYGVLEIEEEAMVYQILHTSRGNKRFRLTVPLNIPYEQIYPIYQDKEADFRVIKGLLGIDLK